MLRILVCFLAVLILPNGVLGQIEGTLLIDRNEIFRCMPVTGAIELRPKQDVKLDGPLNQILSIKNGGYNIVIDEPGGSHTIIDEKPFESGISKNTFQYNGLNGVLESGVVYTIPVFLLKFPDRFLFETIGEYHLTFEFTCLPGSPRFDAIVNVKNCDPCGRERFTQLFGHQILLRPFDGGLGIKENGIGLSDTYKDAFAVSIANLSIGVGRFFFKSKPGSLTHSFYESDRFRDEIEKGLFWDSTLAKSRGIWSIISERYNIREATGKDPLVEKIDNKGRVIILPN